MEKRKQLTFDIDTRVAKAILGEQNYTSVYANIRKFMENERWVHIEGSAYMSLEPLSNSKVILLLDQLKEKYPYLSKCIREMHQADISRVHSLDRYFEYDGTPGRFVQKDKQQVQSEKRRSSILVKLEEKRQVVAKREANQADELQRKHQKNNRSL